MKLSQKDKNEILHNHLYTVLQMNNVYTSTTEFKWPEKYNRQILVNLDVNFGLKTFHSFYLQYIDEMS